MALDRSRDKIVHTISISGRRPRILTIPISDRLALFNFNFVCVQMKYENLML